MSFFNELKRRNVFKVTIAYVVMAWLVIQVADVILNNVNMPGWVFHVLLFFLVSGLPIAVLFAWAFEMTPEGLKREHDSMSDAMAGISDGQKVRWLRPTLAFIAMIFIAAIGWWSFQQYSIYPGDAKTIDKAKWGSLALGVALPSGPRIAILPFKNLSDDKEQEYFSDGLTEDIITALSGTELFVLGFSTNLHKFRDMSVTDIGKDLGVRYLLKGSVRRDANIIRVAGQLFDTESGTQIWGESYSRDLTVSDIFVIQDDITARVVGTIADASGIINRKSLEELRRNPTRELAAYECVLRSYAYEGVHTAEAHLSARDCIESSIELDSDYVEALSTAAYLYREEHFHDFNQRPDALKHAMSFARKAIELDPLNQNAYFALAFIYFDLGVSELDAFFAAAKRAIELNPNNSRVIGGMGVLLAFAGEWEWGIDLLEKTMSINPYSHMNGWLHFTKATDYFRLGLYPEALAEIKLSPFRFPVAHINNIAIHAKLGDQESATAALKEALSVHPKLREDARAQLEHFYPAGNNLHDQLIEGVDKAASWIEE